MDESLWMAEVQASLGACVGPEDRMLVAVSAGADSVALLCLLTDALGMARERLAVLHVNHGIRPDGCDDEALVQALCSERGVQCDVARVDVPALARKEHLSLEVAARRLRYSALEVCAAERGCRWILVGHTLDDSAETVLLRMLSGAPWYEWTGIPARRGNILRPLVRVPRRLPREWITARGIPFRDDLTNSDLRHARNRLRDDLLRKGDFWNSDRVGRLADGGRELEDAMRAYRRVAEIRCRAAGDWVRTGGICLETEEIFRYFSSLTFMPVEVAWAALSGRAGARLPSAIRRQIVDCVGGRSSGGRIALPGNIEFERHGDTVCLSRVTPPLFERTLALGRTDVPERDGAIELKVVARSHQSPHDATQASARLTERKLMLRVWHPGETIRLPGRPTKKIADILAERGVDAVTRRQAMIVADGDGPLWIVGGPLAERALPLSGEEEALILSWIPRNGCCRSCTD